MSVLVVASIDFGTTYSGWAFSFKHEFQRDPLQTSAKQWIGGQLVSLKAPTCVLIMPDGVTLAAFGYEAESKYAELAQNRNHKEWYFFKRFKMMLFGKIGLQRNIMIEDATGKKLEANKVFSASIKFLKNDLMEISESRISGGGLTAKDIHWVLTVPAIWNDSAKQFMREAAQNAGIPKDKLSIALEPEAASLYCRHLPIEKGQSSLSNFNAGTQYLVLDAGGGTVDITVHKITSDGELKELLAASGGAWGGTNVDEAFENFLIDISSAAVMHQLKGSHMEDYVDMFRDFEIKKRGIAPNKEDKVTLRLPAAFVDLVKSIHKQTLDERIASTKYCDKIEVVGDKFRINADIAQGFFYSPVKCILDHLSTLMKNPKVRGCTAILMVGGFSESPMLQESIKKRFSDKKVIVPAEAGLAVLKGAVIFGHSPNAIVKRICKYTYGIETTHENTRSCKHRPGKTYIDGNKVKRCHSIFDIHVRIGDAVKLGEKQPESIHTPVTDDQTDISFCVFASLKPNPEFITDEGCYKIGQLNIPIPDTTSGRKRKFGVSFIFGGTEIEVEIVDKVTGKITTTRADFLG